MTYDDDFILNELMAAIDECDLAEEPIPSRDMETRVIILARAVGHIAQALAAAHKETLEE